MKKDGFTLVELLAVVTILSILLLLVVPKIVNQLNNSKDEVNNATKKLIYAATEKYIKDFNIDPKDTYCIPLEDLERDEYISDTITDNNSGIDLKESKAVRLKYKENHGYSYELMTKKECNQEMGMLSEGLIPVAYDGDNWVVVSQTNKNGEWYDYDEQKWANAVVLKQGIKKEIGDEVKVDGTEATMMYVWIPRYEYKYTNLGNQYAGGTQAQPGEIEINFVSKETTIPSSDDYKVHPAFTFGTEEKSGMWVGKFELSHTTKSQGTEKSNEAYNAANLNCTDENCIETQYLRILPNVPSLRYNTVSNFFYAIKGIASTFGLGSADIHMMKNSEWGAVAYLSQSKYGKYGNVDYENKYKEVYQNKSANYITGKSNVTSSQSGSSNGDLCEYNDMQELGVDENNYKMGQCGPGASTTGNIYGVYDMSGGTYEVVMGVYVYTNGIYSGYNTLNNSGFNGWLSNNGTPTEKIDGVSLPDLKYYDIYMTNTATTACGDNEICYGHALSETSGWYGDLANMLTANYPWFERGGEHEMYIDNMAGVFCFAITSGSVISGSTRVVGFSK